MSSPLTLEPRFQEPEGWQWRFFTNTKGRTLRYGYVIPPKPDAIVIGLQGLSEFTEKYFEVAHDLLKHNIGFWMMDWQGQGKSDRHLPNPHKRYSDTFDEDIADFHQFVTDHVKAETGDTPLVMLGHSMGGNIGLRYLHRHPGVFSCAAFSAPMIGIHALKFIPNRISLILTKLFKMGAKKSYIFGGTDWHKDIRSPQDKARLSSDTTRNMVQDQWCLHDPDLQLGHVTFGWLHEANLSCVKLQQSDIARNIQTPCLFGIASQDKLVDSGATQAFANHMPFAEKLILPNSQHEILMEQDHIRHRFFESFLELIRKNQ